MCQCASARYPPLLCFRDKLKNKERRERVTGAKTNGWKGNKRVDMDHSHSLSQSREGDKGVFANKFVALMREKGRRTYCLIGVSIKV